MVAVSSLVQAALDLQAFCQSKHWDFCFIDGIANARWGQPRYTEDADVSLLTGFAGLRICSAEDFIVYKAFAGRDHDWSDIEGVLQRQPKLNLAIVRQELPWLLETKDDNGISLARLEALFKRYNHV